MVGIGVIGTGYWGKNHVRVFKELETEKTIDCLKICDVSKKRATELGENFHVAYTTDYNDFIKDPKIDAVSIASPSPTHYAIAKKFLENDMDVLIEKPITLESSQAWDLVKIAEKNSKILMAGHLFRYHPAIDELKKRIDRNELGKINFFISNRLDFGVPRSDMGVVFALGIHELDMFCYLLNREYPEEISASVSAFLQPGIEETAIISCSFDKGISGYAIESWLVPAYGKKRELIVVGSERTAKVDYLRPQEIEIFDIRIKVNDIEPLFTVESSQTSKIPIPFKEPLKEELAHFIKSVKSRKEPLSCGKVGARAVEMVEAALKSAKEKRAISKKEIHKQKSQ